MTNYDESTLCGNSPHLSTRYKGAKCLLPAGHSQRHEWPVQPRPVLAWPVGREFGPVSVEDVRASGDAIQRYGEAYDELVSTETAQRDDVWTQHLELARLEAERTYLLERLLMANLDTPS